VVQEEIAEASRFYKLDVLLKELSGAVPAVTEFVRRKVIRYKSEMFDAANETDSEGEDGGELEMMNALLIGESKVWRPAAFAFPNPLVNHAELPRLRLPEPTPTDEIIFNAQVRAEETKAERSLCFPPTFNTLACKSFPPSFQQRYEVHLHHFLLTLISQEVHGADFYRCRPACRKDPATQQPASSNSSFCSAHADFHGRRHAREKEPPNQQARAEKEPPSQQPASSSCTIWSACASGGGREGSGSRRRISTLRKHLTGRALYKAALNSS
jgi:hypothetical protein